MAAVQLLTPRRGALAAGAATGVAAASLTYSASGKLLFQRQGHVVRVLNAKSGQLLHECVRSEEAAAAQGRAEVTALALHPHNALQLLAAYADGKILVWDFVEEKVLQQFDAKAPVLWMGSSAATPSILMLVVSTANDKQPEDKSADAGWALVEFNMKKKRRGRSLLQHNKLPFHTAAMQSYRSSEASTEVQTTSEAFEGDYVVVAAGSKLFALRVRRTDGASTAVGGRPFTIQKLVHLRDVTCLAVNPRALEFAVGDQLGQMFRYLDTDSQQAAASAKMHWHSHAVQCLTYSRDGKFLLSGGEECVFVSWNLESGRRSYLPRRSAPLTSIATSPDGAVYAVALGDHVLFQYNHITREEEWQSLGLARSGDRAELTLPSRNLAFDPISHAIPLNGVSSAGVLQFYDPYKDRVLQSVLLTERNQVTRTEDEEIPQVVAEHVCFSPSGAELVTLHANVHNPNEVEPIARRGGEEQALRFWKRRADGSFYVNTAVDGPHGNAPVTCLAFSPSPYDECVVTGDASGDFKIWKKVHEVASATASSSSPSTSWLCQSVVKFRDAPITAAAFADDGSLLAVAYGHLLTLWDVATNSLRQVISSADGEAIRSVAFTGKASPYVVLTTATQVQVWNLLRLELWWRYEVPENAAFVSANAERERFLVWLRIPKATPEHVMLEFSPKSPVPVSISPVDVGADANIWSVAYHPRNGDIVILDSLSNVWRLGADGEEFDKSIRKQSQEEEQANALSALYAQRKKTGQQRSRVAKNGTTSSPQAHGLFEAPAHVLPSMTALYRSFMDTMLPKPHQATSGDEDGEDVKGKNDKKARKKQNKKRKKQQSGKDGDADVVAGPEGEDDTDASRQKRMKQRVEKELANHALQQQTYSKLLEAFRKNRQSK